MYIVNIFYELNVFVFFVLQQLKPAAAQLLTSAHAVP